MRHIILFICFAFIVSACSTSNSLVTSPGKITKSQAKPTLSLEGRLERISKISILPVVGADAPVFAMQRSSDALLLNKMRSQNPGLVIIDAQSSLAVLGVDGAHEGELLSVYTHTGEPNANRVRSIGQSLDVDAIMQGHIRAVEKQDGEFGLMAGRTRIEVSYSLMDATDGRVVWEKTVSGLKETLTTLQSAPSTASALTDATTTLLSAVPKLRPIQTAAIGNGAQ